MNAPVMTILTPPRGDLPRVQLPLWRGRVASEYNGNIVREYGHDNPTDLNMLEQRE